MPSRITAALLFVLLFAVCSMSLALESSPSGVKSTVPEAQAGEPLAVPASSPWGMLIMIVLVLTASTFAMMGNGFQFRLAGPVQAAVPRDDPEPERRSARSPHSPKNKSKRAFSHQRVSRSQSRNEARRARNLARSRRRREGPGCRGIR
jgi:hypothetical protein